MTVDSPVVPDEAAPEPSEIEWWDDSLEADTPRFVRTDIGGTAALLTAVRRELGGWAMAEGLPDDDLDDLMLASYEALANAVEHAFGPEPGNVDLAAVRRRDGHIQVTVRDNGRWRPPPADPGFRGRGLLMITALAHRSEIHRGSNGTAVHMQWRLPS